jgi:hypothetical protein
VTLTIPNQIRLAVRMDCAGCTTSRSRGTWKHKKQKSPPGEIPPLHSAARLNHGPPFPEIHVQQFDSLLPDRAHGARYPAARPASGRVGPPSSDSDGLRVDTHWTRILYYDVLTTQSEVSTPATKVSARKAGFGARESATEVAVLLLAIVVALCLAVVNVFVLPEVGAAALDTSRISAASDNRAGSPTPSPGVWPCPQ